MVDVSSSSNSPSDLSLVDEVIDDPSNEYVQLQQRIFMANVYVILLAVSLTAIFFEQRITISLLIGAISGLLYLRLLARSIGKLGKSSKTVGKIQLIVPVILVLAASRLQQLDLLLVSCCYQVALR